MEVDWKALAKSPGYMSLKRTYTSEVMRNKTGRKKPELYKLFCWVIARAQHYAHRKNISIEEVLNTWEAGRDYWWLNYYQEGRQPKLPSGKPRNIKPSRSETYIKRAMKKSNRIELLDRLRGTRRVEAIEKRKAIPKAARWGAANKKHQARAKLIRSKNL